MRSGASSRPSASCRSVSACDRAVKSARAPRLVEHQRVRRVPRRRSPRAPPSRRAPRRAAGCGRAAAPLGLPALGPALREPGLELVGVVGQLGHEHLAGRVDVVVVRVPSSTVSTSSPRVTSSSLSTDPAAGAADAAAADDELLHARRELVVGDAEHVRVDVLAEHDRRLGERRLHRADRVAVLRGRLVVQRGGGLPHPLRQVAAEPLVAAAHERGEVLGEVVVRLLRDAVDAGRRALADVAEQARPTGVLGPR